ncbi:MFS transporter [Candidatus Saccharibacteria bacterium]|nr:MFS transporter [Candidatus Saccharibacteria bacterium]
MIQNFISLLLEKRHFWRYASFSEVAELYTSRTLRVVGTYIASGFASVYLYQEGYSLSFIMAYWSCYFLFKALLSVFAARFAGRFGPKHGILLSNILYIPAMIALGFVPDLGLSAIIVWGLFMSLSSAIYQLCYFVDFSKIKSITHAGKEIGFMNILEKIAIGVSPIIGGLVALLFGAQVIMWTAAAIFALGALPLLNTVEQTRTHQKIDFRGFPWRIAIRSLVAQMGVGFDVVATGTVWGLFITIVIFPHLGNELYVSLGTLSSVTILAAIGISYAYGVLIDKNKGGDLLKISVVVNALVHASRPFATGVAPVVGTNIVNEIATTGISMAYMRGMFDTADLSGHRIVYLLAIEIMSNIGAALACLVLLVCISYLGDPNGLRLFFFIAAGFVLLTGTAHFRLYRK